MKTQNSKSAQEARTAIVKAAVKYLADEGWPGPGGEAFRYFCQGMSDGSDVEAHEKSAWETALLDVFDGDQHAVSEFQKQAGKLFLLRVVEVILLGHEFGALNEPAQAAAGLAS